MCHMRFITLFIVFIMSFKVYSQDTFSIIAIDPETGEVGAAGATCLYNQNDGIIDIIVLDDEIERKPQPINIKEAEEKNISSL